MPKYLKTTPEATKDILSRDCYAKNNLTNKLMSYYQIRGFDEVKTPALEYYDVFEGSKANIPQQTMYKLTDNNGRLIVLRPDCTIPMARVAATRLKEAPKPLRLCYNQNIYVVNTAHSGKSNEITQVGIELMGSKTKKSDLEVISLAFESLKQIEDSDFRLELCHIGYFKGIMDCLDASEDEKEEIRELVAKKNYSALSERLKPYEKTKAYKALMLLPRLFGGIEVLQDAKEVFINDKTNEALCYLGEIYENLEKLGIGDKISIDLGMVNKADYYTGIIFKGYFDGVGEEVLSGGRYDNLSAVYGEDLPAVGFGINIDITSNLKKPREEQQDKVLVFATDGFEAKALTYAESFCEENVLAEYSVFDTIEETTTYAKAKGFKRIMVVG
ncbi:MAG: ATP phosphoribosyltransferase regulatory subunit, partial [Oscillospiraceae bacterium]